MVFDVKTTSRTVNDTHGAYTVVPVNHTDLHGNYTDLHGNYTDLHGNYTDLHGNYTVATRTIPDFSANTAVNGSSVLTFNHGIGLRMVSCDVVSLILRKRERKNLVQIREDTCTSNIVYKVCNVWHRLRSSSVLMLRRR